MPEVLDLYTNYSWSWVDAWGKETHGNGRCTSPLEALTKVCKASGAPVTEELKEKFGVNDNVSSLKAEVDRLNKEIHVMKETMVKTLDLVQATNATVKKATERPVAEKAKGKGGRPAGSKNKK